MSIINEQVPSASGGQICAENISVNIACRQAGLRNLRESLQKLIIDSTIEI